MQLIYIMTSTCRVANYQEVQKHHAEWNNPALLSHAKGGGGSKSEVGLQTAYQRAGALIVTVPTGSYKKMETAKSRLTGLGWPNDSR